MEATPAHADGSHRTLYPHFLHIGLCGLKSQPGPSHMVKVLRELSGKDLSDCVVAPEPRRCKPGDQGEHVWPPATSHKLPATPAISHPSHQLSATPVTSHQPLQPPATSHQPPAPSYQPPQPPATSYQPPSTPATSDQSPATSQ